jgi:Domain of unknown function (DUF4169)
MTAEIINLRKVRKSKARDAKASQASANREKFGLTKIERARSATEAARSATLLDGAKITPATNPAAANLAAANPTAANQGSFPSTAAHDDDDDLDPGNVS